MCHGNRARHRSPRPRSSDLRSARVCQDRVHRYGLELYDRACLYQCSPPTLDLRVSLFLWIDRRQSVPPIDCLLMKSCRRVARLIRRSNCCINPKNHFLPKHEKPVSRSCLPLSCGLGPHPRPHPHLGAHLTVSRLYLANRIHPHKHVRHAAPLRRRRQARVELPTSLVHPQRLLRVLRQAGWHSRCVSKRVPSMHKH